MLELAELIWKKIHGDGRPFRYVSDEPFHHDVQMRVPDVREGAARCSASRRRRRSTEMLDEVIPWIRAEALVGRL